MNAVHTFVIVTVIFVLSIAMILSGLGGGNFYVAALVLSGVPKHTASTKSQFILFLSVEAARGRSVVAVKERFVERGHRGGIARFDRLSELVVGGAERVDQVPATVGHVVKVPAVVGTGK